MEKLKSALVVCLLLCGCVALLSVSIAILHISVLAIQLNQTAKDADKLVKDADTTVVATRSQLSDTINNINAVVIESKRRIVDTSQNLNAILIQAGLASDEVRKAAMEQRQYWDQSGAETVKLLGNANQAVDSLHEAAQAIPPTLKDSQLALEQASLTMNDASKILTDPNLAATLLNIQITTGHIAAISDLAETRFRQMMKPANVFKTLMERALGIAGSVAEIVK